MNPRLQQIARQLDRSKQAAEKAPASDLGDAIGQLIEQAVQERVSQALERQQPTGLRLRQIFNAPPARTDFAQVPEPQRTPLPTKAIPPMTLHRDGDGRAAWVEIGGVKMEVIRNDLGRIIGMRQRDESPVLPALEIPFKADARQYNPGEPQ